MDATLPLWLAAEEGIVYFPYQSTQIYGGPDPDPSQQFLAPEHQLPTERVAVGSPEDIVIICEGQNDKVVLTELGARILRARRLSRRIAVIPAMGKRGIPLLANGLRELSSGARFVLVADSDGDPEGTATITEGLSIFTHYRKEFLSERILKAGPEENQASVDPHTKVTWFVDRHLSLPEKRRFFPVCPAISPLPAW
jgi:hypothetical protein